MEVELRGKVPGALTTPALGEGAGVGSALSTMLTPVTEKLVRSVESKLAAAAIAVNAEARDDVKDAGGAAAMAAIAVVSVSAKVIAAAGDGGRTRTSQETTDTCRDRGNTSGALATVATAAARRMEGTSDALTQVVLTPSLCAIPLATAASTVSLPAAPAAAEGTVATRVSEITETAVVDGDIVGLTDGDMDMLCETD